MNDLMSKLDETEADIARMTSQIEQAQDVIDEAEQGLLQKNVKKARKNKEQKSSTKTKQVSKLKDEIATKKVEKTSTVDESLVDKMTDKSKTSAEKEEKEEKPGQSKVSVKMTNLSPNLGGLQVSKLGKLFYAELLFDHYSEFGQLFDIKSNQMVSFSIGHNSMFWFLTI